MRTAYEGNGCVTNYCSTIAQRRATYYPEKKHVSQSGRGLYVAIYGDKVVYRTNYNDACEKR